MEKKISIIGISTVIVYFISVGGFLITQTEIALTIWEMMTIISGPVVFMVLAFLCISIAKSNREETKGMQIIALIDGILCLVGFAGALCINENMWYVAPMGYGLGLLVLCATRLRVKER